MGIAVVNTWLGDETRIHVAHTGESLGAAAARAPDAVAALAARIGQSVPDPAQALLLARSQFAHIVGREALTSAFNENFQTMAWIFLAALILVPLCRPAPPPLAGVKPQPAPDAH